MSDYLPSFIVEPVLRQARRFSERITGDDSPPSTVDFSTNFTSSSRFTLPTVPVVDLQRFNLTRLWVYPPTSTIAGPGETSGAAHAGGGLVDAASGGSAVSSEGHEEEEPQETTLQSIARNVQLWAAQINNLDVFPSPPLVPTVQVARSSMEQIPFSVSDNEHIEPEVVNTTIPFPTLENTQDAHVANLDEDLTTPQQQEQPNRREQQPQRTDSETSLNPAHELSYRSRVLEHQGEGRSQSDLTATANMAHLGGIPGDGFGESDYTRRRDGSGALPEDDGMGPLRKRIHAIWAGPGTAQEKSNLVHVLMQERHKRSQGYASSMLAGPVNPPARATSPSNISVVSEEVIYNLSPTDLEPTYAPLEAETSSEHQSNEPGKPELGCIHYQRNVKMQCAECDRWYTCRLCHDEVENHTLPRRETKHMLCMVCNTPQSASQFCRMCGTQAACYYCGVCKLWNNDANKSIYHCDDCGICRLGKGLGKDFFHCKTCAACMSIQAESTHKCIEKSTKCDCPICGEYMFTSNKPVAFMRCGHGIHENCFAKWCNTSYKCPICSKSIANMESQFRRLDRHIEDQPMPEEYRSNRAYIFCNDCNSRSVTKYHWLGLKCEICYSYNTAQLELLGAESPALLERADRAQELGVGEAGITASQSHTPTEELTSPPSGPQTVATPGTTGRPSSRPSTRSVSGVDIVRSPPSRRDSPFHHLPHSPTRPVRGASPVVGSYFGTGQVRQSSETRRGSYFSVFSAGSNAQVEEPNNLGPAGYQQAEHRSLSTSNLSRTYSKPSTGSMEDLPHAHGTITPRSLRDFTPPEDDDDLDFWGGQSPRSYESELVDVPDDTNATNTARGHDQDSDDDDDDDETDEYEKMDEDSDDDEEEDLMDILGHR